ncbi:MAG: family 16 glycosylhydrolase [Firmicutes bacterium]|nr:family 16 glycosylhydrolase [Bacillota bacterium]
MSTKTKKTILTLIAIAVVFLSFSGCINQRPTPINVTITNPAGAVMFDDLIDFRFAVMATTSGNDDTISFAIDSNTNYFGISRTTGQVTVSPNVTHGASFTVTATSNSDNTRQAIRTFFISRLSSTLCAVVITNSSDEIVFEELDNLRFLITATSTGDNDTISFAITSRTAFFRVDSATGWVTVSPSVTNGESFVVRATSSVDATKSDDKTFVISRRPEFDRIPVPTDANFVEDFSQGIRQDRWFVVTDRWGGLVNNPYAGTRWQGTLADNVSVTECNILLLRARGRFNNEQRVAANGNPSGNLVPLSGAAIASRQSFGFGSYRVAMRVLPRLGVCNSMWTFLYANGGNINHEIDIELPGHNTAYAEGSPARRRTISYQRTLLTNWTSAPEWGGAPPPSKYSSDRITETPANDGRWNEYRFDWYPDRIEFFVNGVRQNIHTDNVPFYRGLFWLGVWLPLDWCGFPNFEEDYMMVDWFAFTPFEKYNQNMYHNGNRNIRPRNYMLRNIPANRQMPKTNYLSNRDFEGNPDAWARNANATIHYSESLANTGERSLRLTNDGQASQTIEAVYEGFAFDFSAYTKSIQGAGRFEVEFHDEWGDRVGNIIRFAFASPQGSHQWHQVNRLLIAPPNSSTMTITARAEVGQHIVHVDDMSLRLNTNTMS